MWSCNHITCMTIDVEPVYIDIGSFYLFKMVVRKEGGAGIRWGAGAVHFGRCQPQIAGLHKHMATVCFSGLLSWTAKQRLSASCLSVRTCSAAPGGQIFAKSENGGGRLWWKYVQQFRVWLKSDRNIGHSARRPKKTYTHCAISERCEHLPVWQQYCSTTPHSLWQTAKLLPNWLLQKSQPLASPPPPPPPALHSGVDLRCFQYNPLHSSLSPATRYQFSYSSYLHILFNVIRPLLRGLPQFLTPSILPATCFGTLPLSISIHPQHPSRSDSINLTISAHCNISFFISLFIRILHLLSSFIGV